LFGEPGIGKSWALEAEKANLDSRTALNGGQGFWLNLRSFGSEDRLWKTLFESNEFEEWRKGTYLLYVFLDSLDECLLRIDNVATLIADQLPNEPVHRLRLRIACRTAPWPAILENALVKLFGAEGFEAYELAPLRRLDVQQALTQSGSKNTEDFFALVEALDVSAFAIKPVTLQFLINTYLREGSLPANQFDLYEKGCRILCEEPNDSRAGSSRLGMLTPDHRFTIASRIAAVTQFCNRFAVSTAGAAAPIAPEDVSVNDIIGAEHSGSTELVVSPDTIREVLDTGLFSSRGASRIGWAHQTYAEFLASHYCTKREMPTKQLQSLIFHPEGGGQRLIPQLHELAAWISIKRPDFLEIVLSGDPECLLGGAGASLSETQRELIVRSLLKQCANGRLLSLDWNLSHFYAKLHHSKLAEQLQPYLRDPATNLNTRQVVVDIAGACRVAQLASDLADIALDTSQDLRLRIPAGAAAANIGASDVRLRLRPLARGQSGDDPDDELKGIGLTALWPDLMSSTELFSLLTRPANRNLHGAYGSFLYCLTSKLGVDDLPAAIEWFAKQKPRDMGPIDSVMNHIIHLALPNMDTPGVSKGLANAILSRVKLHDQLMSDHDQGRLTAELRTDHSRRQILLRELMPQLTEEDELFYLMHAGVPIVPEFDLPWLIHHLQSGLCGSWEQILIKLIRRIVDTRHPEQMRLLWCACQINVSLNTECGGFFLIALDSGAAKMLREAFRYEQVREEPLLDPSPQARIEQDLINIEKGILADWIQLTRNLSLKPTSTQWTVDSPDLTVLPGWESSNQQTKTRIIAAARRYAEEGEPENDKWFNTSEIYFSAIGGYQALSLLHTVAPALLASISIAAWTKWIPILLKYHHGGRPAVRPLLVHAAYLLIPDEVISRLKQVIDHDNDRHGHLFVGREIEVCWDERIGSALLAKAREPHLKPEVINSLLQVLLEHNVIGARELATSFIKIPPPDRDREKQLMLGAIEALTSNTRDAGWPDVWPIVRDFPTFGRSVVESMSYRHGGSANFLRALTEAQLGDLYAWMLANYPPSLHDHKVSGVLGPSQTAVMLREYTLEHLKMRASFAACEVIRNVMNNYPQYPWLRLHLDESESLARAATWKPASVQEFLRLAENQSKRMVESGEQLLDVICESLDRLQIRMHDELPAAMHLWAPLKKGLKPKYEEDLSDYVALHLKDDLRKNGIVVNREVQIRRNPGQKTDIHVDAVIPGQNGRSFDSLRTIIEVKGDWNSDLGNAMESQLRNDYLEANRFKYGVYLVGWFYCDQWDESDYRKNCCPKISLEQARLQFEAQADSLSTEGYLLRSYVLDVRAS